jgi:hypothetical protein
VLRADGGWPLAALYREYQLSHNVVPRWKRPYPTAKPTPEASDKTARALREIRQQIDELESARGRKTMEVDFLQRCFKRPGLPFPKRPGTWTRSAARCR